MSDKDEKTVATIESFYPDFMRLTKTLLLDEIWNRPGLSQRDRSLITLAALISTHRPGQLPHHLQRAMKNGLTKTELQEIFIHLAFYAGFPASFAGIDVAINTLKDE